jgi:hypothetical protein
MAGTDTSTYFNDVWASFNGKDWIQITANAGYICIYMYIYTNAVCVCMYVYIHVCICVYIYTYGNQA